MKALYPIVLAMLALTACGRSATNVYIKDYQPYTSEQNLASQNRSSIQSSPGYINYLPQDKQKKQKQN